VIFPGLLYAALLLMWIGCIFGAIVLHKCRQELKRQVTGIQAAIADSKTQALAGWARDTKITVCSVTGTWFSMTLAELAASPVPYRCWNVPTSVEFHPASMDVTAYVDQEHAKEHRG
jgi:hypothetical protein